MKNPFQYGGVVGKDAFCNRTKEQADLLRAMENGEKVFLYSERRLGKTSLVKLTLDRLPKKRFVTIYIDLWPTDGEQSFVTTVAKAITKSLSTTTDSMLATAKSLFSRLTPSITVDEEGNPSLTFGMNKSTRGEPELDEALATPQKISKKGKKQVVIVFDEFQRILEYGNDSVERKLRSIIQTQSNVAYIFMGSRKHLIQKMFLEKSRPLYRSAAHYPIKAIAEKDWLPFIRSRFHQARKHITDEQIRLICNATQGHPFYTQHLCHVLWELSDAGKNIPDQLLDEAITILLERESFAYTTLWDSLTQNQRRFVKALASEELGVKPFSSEFIQKHRLGSISSMQRVVPTLSEKDVIEPENDSFIIVDRFFRLWLRRCEIA